MRSTKREMEYFVRNYTVIVCESWREATELQRTLSLRERKITYLQPPNGIKG